MSDESGRVTSLRATDEDAQFEAGLRPRTLDEYVGQDRVRGRSSLLGVKYDFYIRGPWFEVRDPAKVGDRVTLLTYNEVSLFVLAQKISREVIFKTTPQQSD